jgi:hypothetical protein
LIKSPRRFRTQRSSACLEKMPRFPQLRCATDLDGPGIRGTPFCHGIETI